MDSDNLDGPSEGEEGAVGIGDAAAEAASALIREIPPIAREVLRR